MALRCHSESDKKLILFGMVIYEIVLIKAYWKLRFVSTQAGNSLKLKRPVAEFASLDLLDVLKNITAAW